MTFSIRQTYTDQEDAAMLSSIMHRSVHGVANAAYTEQERAAWSPAPRMGEDARQRFAGQRLWLAEDADGPCAFMTLTEDGYLDFAYALPRASGKGAASMVYAALEDWARGAAHPKLTSDISLVARPFFEKRGWTMIAKQDNDCNGVILVNFRMEKNLGGRRE